MSTVILFEGNVRDQDVWIGKPSREAQGINFFVLFFFLWETFAKNQCRLGGGTPGFGEKAIPTRAYPRLRDRGLFLGGGWREQSSGRKVC